MANLIGTVLKGSEGKEYTVKDRFPARGAHSRMYLVEDKSGRPMLAKTCSIKNSPVIHRAIKDRVWICTGDEDHRDSPWLFREYSDILKKEIETLRGLKHRNIIELLDSGSEITEDSDFAYVFYTMPVCGQNAQHLMRTYGCEKAKLIVMYHIACALEHMHSEGYIHRDIKPSNIVFKDKDECLANPASLDTALIDFGLAGRDGENIEVDKEDDVPIIRGTVEFLAPELLSLEVITTEIDMYSMGILGYALLAGEYPFVEMDEQGRRAVPSIMTLVDRYTQEVPRVSQALNYEIPSSVDDLVFECMSIVPSIRPSAAGFRQRLRNILEKEYHVDVDQL